MKSVLFYSVENIKVVVVKQLDVLLLSGTEALKQVIKISNRKLSGIFKGGHIVLKFEMLFDGFNDVTFTFKLEHLFGDHDGSIINVSADGPQGAQVFVQAGGVTESALIVRNGPGGSGNNAHRVVSILERKRSHKRVLGTEIGAGN